ncbi:MAG: YeeE/YedE family protein [Casimicrobiaceae bacterium]
MYALYSFLAGLIFGIGLIVSEMFSPVKVLGFLDLSGKWDPSLLLVMGAAVAVGLVAFTISGRRTSTLIGTPMHLPQTRDIDRKLVLGSAVFGIGWGLAGFCPGPAIVALGTGHVKAFLFVVAMLAGMGVYELIEHRRGKSSTERAGAPRKSHAPDAPRAAHAASGGHGTHAGHPGAPATPAKGQRARKERN